MSHKVRGGGRRCARWLTSLALGWTGFAAWQQSAQAGPMVNRGVAATAVIQRTIPLAIGCHTFETKNPTPAIPGNLVDSVMHIWGTPDGVSALPVSTYGGPKQELDRNDDVPPSLSTAPSSIHLSRIQYFCITVPKVVEVIVYALTPTTAGKVDLSVTSVTASSPTPVTTNYVTQGKIGSTQINAPISFTGPAPNDLDVETAFEPGGTDDSLLYSFAWDGRLTGWDDDAGIGWQSKLRASETYFAPPGPAFRWDLAVSWVRVASTTAFNEGTVSVIFNDYDTDFDGDTLGKSLEDELGTCDNRHTGFGCPSWFYGPAALSYDAADTDRDGIRDDYEVFGREVATDPDNPQYLPKWGANPMHKDVFVEMDWQSAPSHIVDFGFLQQVQNHYLAAPASHILNPDGYGGITLHVDIGKPPPGPSNTLFGDWGGSNRVANDAWNHFSAYAAEMPPTNARSGLFRYALAQVIAPSATAGGQAWGDHFEFGISTTYSNQIITNFTHELGHTLDLEHHGDPGGSWGVFNCNPLYRSLMNYTEPDLGFSLGANADIVVDPSNLFETDVPLDFNWHATAGTGCTAPPLLRSTLCPYGYPTNVEVGSLGPYAYSVDFNRDGEYATPPTGGERAPFPWPTTGYNGCNTHANKSVPLVLVTAEDVRRPFLTTSVPLMLQAPNKMYLLRNTVSGIAYAWTLRQGPDNNGSCANAIGGSAMTAADLLANCDSFTEDLGIVPGTASIKGFSAIYTNDNKVLVAYRSSTNEIKAVEGYISGGLITWGTTTSVELNANSDPELAVITTAKPGGSGVDFFHTVTYVRADGNFAWRKKLSGASWGVVNPLLTDVGLPIAGTGATALAATLSQPPVLASAASLTGPYPVRTCAIFPSGGNQEATFYCYNPNTDRWILHPNAFKLGGATLRLRQKAGLAMHYPRASDGGLWNMGGSDVRAQFWATLAVQFDPRNPTKIFPPDDTPYVWTTNGFPFNLTSVPNNLVFTATAPLHDGTTTLGLTTLFETQDSTGLRAAYFGHMIVDDVALPTVRLLPFVDGGLKSNVSDGSDFRVMERGICSRLSGGCTVKNQWGY